MIVTLINPNTQRRWQVRPSDNGLDFQIWKEQGKVGKKLNNGRTIKNEWVFTGYYPSNLPAAVEHTIELMLSDSDDQTEWTLEATDKKYLKRQYKIMIDEITNDIEVTIRKKRAKQTKTK